MNIKVEKLTDIDLLHKANSFTTGRDSKMSLRRAYASMHSPIRTQLFFIEMEDIPLFCASQFVRSKVGVEWWQRSKRTDRGGEDFEDVCGELSYRLRRLYENETENLYDIAIEVQELPDRFDRFSPTSLAGLFNAEAIINMSHKRLCMKASKETREIWEKVIERIKEVDQDLYPYLVKPCVATGVCREKCCGYINLKSYQVERMLYKDLFKDGK